MCGIAGAVYSSDNPRPIFPAQLVTKRLSHRGPDGKGLFTFDGFDGRIEKENFSDQKCRVAFLHLRLSIIDLSDNASQPMASEDGRFTITFNGEIYNYLELRNELQQLGIRFTSASDTEVLLKGYIQWGKALLPKLVGMFAFAIFDKDRKSVFLARDFFGIKPLYYSASKGGLFFASEIPALLAMTDVRLTANAERVLAYLRHGLCDGPEETFFKNIRQLPPSHYAEVSLASPDSVVPVRYWDLPSHQSSLMSYQDSAERLREIFLESINLHMRSDVAIGACLSGGLDSSSIVMAMRSVSPPNQSINTFSFLPSDPRISEEKWIDIVNGASESHSFKTHLEPSHLQDDLGELIRYQGEPTGSASVLAQYKVFQLAQQNRVKVLIDGQGSDELLAGYFIFLSARWVSLVRQRRFSEAAKLYRSAQKLPGVSAKMFCLYVAGMMTPEWLQVPVRRYVLRDLMPSFCNADYFAKNGAKLGSFHFSGSKHHLKSLLRKTFTDILLPQLLRFEDRNSMRFSIESRVPFLTPKMAEFAFSLPEEFLITPEGKTKTILRSAMQGIVPNSILERKDKIGFETPETAMLSEVRDWVAGTVSKHLDCLEPVVDPKKIQSGIEKFRQGNKPDFPLWKILNLIEWTRISGATYA